MLASLLVAAVVAQPATYRIDPARAEAGFDLKATLHTVHGVTTKLSGEVHAVPEAGGALALTGKIVIDAASLDTGNAKRDATMRGTSLDVAKFPSITLEPERFEPSGGRLTGKLTIRGVTREAAIEMTLTPDGSGWTAEGRFDVTWAEFGIPDPSFAFVRIAKVARARFRATFMPAA